MLQRTIHQLLCRSSRRQHPAAVAILFMLALGVTSATAQSNQGTILGTVKDSTGAIVRGAQITLTSTDEGVVRETQSNSSGNFQFLDSKTGHYTIAVVGNGFEKWSETNAVLATRQQLRFDVVLHPGNIQQEVVVSGDLASAIETETNSISAVYTHEDVENLPVNNRAGSGWHQRPQHHRDLARRSGRGRCLLPAGRPAL